MPVGSVNLRLGQRVRLTIAVAAQPSGANPWLFESELGRYYTAFVRDGSTQFRASHFGGPPFWVQSVAVTQDSANPRMAVDATRKLWLVYEDTAQHGVRLTSSQDEGATWETPTMAIPGGSNPTVGVGTNGLLIVAAVVSGKIQGQLQYPGDLVPRGLFTFQAWNGTALADMAVADDTFHIGQERGPQSRWWLHVLLASESATSHWWSADSCATFTRAPT